MSIQEKLDTIKRAREFNMQNMSNIRFDANIPITIILPSDWTSKFKQQVEKGVNADGSEYTRNVTILYVKLPNSVDPEQLRPMKCSEALWAEISTVVEEAVDREGWEGDIIMIITKVMKGNKKFPSWSVKGDKFQPKVEVKPQ
jgi:hypothetical protein